MERHNRRARAFAFLAASVALAALAMPSCKELKDVKKVLTDKVAGSPAKKTLSGGSTCFVLPGATRGGLFIDEKETRAYYTQVAVTEDGKTRSDLYEFDFQTKAAKLLLTDVEGEVLQSGSRFFFLRRIGESKGSLGRNKGLFSAVPGKGEPQLLSDGAESVSGFALDRLTNTVYFAAFAGTEAALKKVPALGGKAESIGKAFMVWDVVSGGKTLLVRSTTRETQKLPVTGIDATTIAPDTLYLRAIGPDAVMNQQKERLILKVPVAGGAGATIPYGKEDNLVFSRSRFFLERRDGSTRTLVRLDGTELTPLISTQGVSFAEAEELSGGAIVALLRQDTNGDGEFKGDDEDDLCVLDPDTKSVGFKTRGAPLRFAGKTAGLPGALAAAGFAAAKARFIEYGTVLKVDASGSCPADPEILRWQVREIQKQAASLLGDQGIGVALDYPRSECNAALLRSPVSGAFLSYAGAFNQLLPAKSEYAIEVYPRVSRAYSYYDYEHDTYTFTGKVTNLTEAPLDVDGEFGARSYKPDLYGPVVKRAQVALQVEPLKTAAYKVPLGKLSNTYTDFTQRFFVNGKEVPFFNSWFFQDGSAWLDAARKVNEKTGFVPRKADSLLGLTGESEHAYPSFDVPASFADMPYEEKGEFAKFVWKTLKPHFKKFHNRYFSVWLYLADKAKWEIYDGRLKDIEQK